MAMPFDVERPLDLVAPKPTTAKVQSGQLRSPSIPGR